MQTVLARLRLFHAFLAVTALLAYVTGEAGIIHAWLGYGIAVLILLRLAWALSGAPQLGLSRYAPHFSAPATGRLLLHPAISRTLLLAIALTVAGATATGIMMDRGRALSLATAAGPTEAAAGDIMVVDRHDDEDHGNAAVTGGTAGTHDDEEEGEHEGGIVYELHEVLANGMLLAVALHVSYLLLFRLPLARYMLFLNRREDSSSARA